MSGTPPFPCRIVRIQAGGWVPLPVVAVIQATLLVHDLGEGVSESKLHPGGGLANQLRLQAVVVGIAVVGFRPDAVPVRVPARDVE